VVVLFVVVFHGRRCRAVIEVAVAVFEVAVNAAIAFVVFAAAVVVVIAVRCLLFLVALKRAVFV
jgi:hypothetical protein